MHIAICEPNAGWKDDAAFIARAREDIPDLLDALEQSQAEAARLRALVGELLDPDPCEYDHHGYCQTHGLSEQPCPHERGKALLKGEK